MQSPEEDRTDLSALARKFPFSLVMTDPTLPDNPLVMVSDAFLAMTGYSRAESLGRNCRFLQGPDTAPEDVAALRDAIAAGRDIQIDLVNYRKDGTAFQNRLLVGPVRDDSGRIVQFVGIQFDLANSAPNHARQIDVMLSEVQHRVKNHLAMIVGMIRLQASEDVRSDLEPVARRVEALQLLYHEMTLEHLAGMDEGRIAIGSYIARIAAVLGAIDGRGSVSVNVEADDTLLGPDSAARLGLIFSEILTNALRHAFVGRDDGEVRATLLRTDPANLRVTIVDDGVGLPEGAGLSAVGQADGTGGVREHGLGTNIVLFLLRSLKGRISVDRPERGTEIVVDIPLPDG